MVSPASTAQAPARRSLLATVWPPSRPEDTEAQSRRKVAVRSAQLAVAGMVTAAVLGAIAADYRNFSLEHLLGLTLAGLLYGAWCLHGMRGPVSQLLGEDTTPLTPGQPHGSPARLLFYFTVQVTLAAVIFALSTRLRGGALAWLVLLPPVAHSVILLPRAGVGLVAMTMVGIFVVCLGRQLGWAMVPGAVVAFSFAVLFTLIFTVLAVSAERSRREVQSLADELAAANEKLRAHAVQAGELAATRERNRIAREVHDSLGHYLTVVNMQLEAARAVQEQNPGAARTALDKAQSLTQEGLKDIRRSVAMLRAQPLENQSLAQALSQLAEASRAGGLTVDLEVQGPTRELNPPAALTLYRAGQEGLTNVRKHSGAERARLILDFREPHWIRLQVIDTGAGAAAAGEPRTGFGLLGLRERAQLLGGTVRTKTGPGAGFTLEVEVPG